MPSSTMITVLLRRFAAGRRNWTFGAVSDMKLSGFYAEDRTFAPVPLDVRDPETGAVTRFRIIGVLRDTMPLEMAGIATSQPALQGFGARAAPSTHLFALEAGVDARGSGSGSSPSSSPTAWKPTRSPSWCTTTSRATYLPARHASRVYPAEALRYQ